MEMGAGKQRCLGFAEAICKLTDAALSWVYPPRCMVCEDILPRNGPKRICENCAGLMVPIAKPVCVMCGAPAESEGAVCALCRKRKRVFGNTALFVYEDVIREVIHRFKYNGRPRYAQGFAELAAGILGEGFFEGAGAFIPVPMHAKKRRRRGYNQAEEFALALSKATGVPTILDYLKRVKNTRPMAGLTPAERASNLQGAFALGKQINVKSVLLIDDIYTTGETLDVCANLLKLGGAEQIGSLTLAVAVRRENQRKPEDAEVYPKLTERTGECHGYENCQ